jgi:hypothetical protein
MDQYIGSVKPGKGQRGTTLEPGGNFTVQYRYYSLQANNPQVNTEQNIRKEFF